MEENLENPVESKPELLAEYRFVITFETYPDDEPYEVERSLMDQIQKALAKEFADEVEFLFGGMVQVRVGSLERGSVLGSVILVLASAITVADFFSKYKDFYESFVLLRSQLRSVLSRVLNRTLPQQVYRTVNITFVPGPATRVVPSVQSAPQPAAVLALYSKAFFIYLLVMNIILTGILFAMVYRAVAAMYFVTP